jgi:hypothetical protein
LEILPTRSTKYVKFSYSVRLAGHVACIFRLTTCWACAPARTLQPRNATAERTNCLIRSLLLIGGL